MAWNGVTTRPPTAPPAQTFPPAATTPMNSVLNSIPAVVPNSNPAGATFDPNDAANPFYLHPNENPSLVLVSTPLNGRNYHPWARAMEMSLMSKNKLGFVDGTIAVLSVGEVKFPYWKRCNNMMSTWIVRSISPEIAQTILWQGTAEKIWNTLKARFSEADIFRISDLHAEIHQTRQGDLTVSAYFAKLKVLWDELEVIRPLPTCKCDKRCDCGLLDTLQQHLENDNLSVFLRGLNETYASVQSQIMMTKPLPSVDEAFLMVQQQERRFNNGVIGLQLPRSGEIQGAGSILLAQGTGNMSGPKKFHPGNKKPVCTYCGLTGHTLEKCYKKNGYPPGWKPRNRSIGAANQVQFTPAEQPYNESGGGVTLSQDEYRLFKQVLQRDNMTYSSPLEVPGAVAPQANLIAGKFAPNTQLEGSGLWEDDWSG